MQVGFRILLLLLLSGPPLLAKGMPPASRIDRWDSKKNQKRLVVSAQSLPSHRPRKLPDGTEEPPVAPWPFVIHVWEQDGPFQKKIRQNIQVDTRYALASHAVPIIRIKPSQGVDLPYLSSVAIKDPMLIVLDRNFKIVGTLKAKKDFTADKLLKLMAKAANKAYQIKLGEYVGRYVKIMQKAEKFWKREERLETDTDRAAEKSGGDQKKALAAIEKAEQQLLKEEAALKEEEDALKARLTLIPEKEEALPTTAGTGRSKRPLTPEELEAIKAYREFRRDENPQVRAAAVEDLGSIDSDVMVAQILKASNDTDPRVVRAAGAALSRMRKPESIEAILAGLQAGKSKAKVAALYAFVVIRHPDAVPSIVAMLRSGGDEIRRAAIEALGNQGDEAATDALMGALQDRLPALRVLAAESLGKVKAKKAGPALVALLQESNWQLQKAAAQALGKIRVGEAIEPLLDLMENGDGLIREVAYKALVEITGQDFALNRIKLWRHWWKTTKGSFKVPTEAELAKARRLAEKALEGYAKEKRPPYHKIVTLSKKMIFVIDVSGSMSDKIILPSNAPQKLIDEFPNRVKMEIAKKEMIDLLFNLDKKVYFNIIIFAGKVKAWSKTMVPASRRTAAIKFVSKLEPGLLGKGGDTQKTNTYGALIEAFGLQGQKVPNWKKRPKADTIFLVTDGVPTIGEIVEVPKLIRAITDLNRTLGMIIHVIAFDGETGKRLAPLAHQNGGKYVLRGS